MKSSSSWFARACVIAVALSSLAACGGLPEDEGPFVATTSSPLCESATLSTAQAGSIVTLTAGSACATSPEYRFFIRYPGDANYAPLGDFTPDNTFAWDSTGQPAGRYLFLVYVREVGSAARYETWITASRLVGAVCSGATLTSAAGVGSVVNMTAASTCAAGTTPEYRFLVRAPGATTYTEVRGYGPGATFSWDSAGWPSGRSELLAYVRVAGNSSSYEAYGATTRTIGTVCTAATLSAVGGAGGIELSATATCAGAAGAEYRFLARAPGATEYAEIRGFGSDATFTWDTSGLSSGKYDVLVYARAAGNLSKHEAYASTKTLVGQACSSASVTVAPGAGVLNLAAAATCAAGVTPEYRYFVRFPGGALLRDLRAYSTNPNHAVNTATLPASGRFEFVVYARALGNTSTYEAVALASSLVGTVCSAATLTVTPGTGRLVNLSATATCTGAATPQYQFLFRRAGTASFVGVRGYGSSGEYVFDTTPVPSGAHAVAVYVRAAGNNSTYEAYATKPLVVQ